MALARCCCAKILIGQGQSHEVVSLMCGYGDAFIECFLVVHLMATILDSYRIDEDMSRTWDGVTRITPFFPLTVDRKGFEI